MPRGQVSPPRSGSWPKDDSERYCREWELMVIFRSIYNTSRAIPTRKWPGISNFRYFLIHLFSQIKFGILLQTSLKIRALVCTDWSHIVENCNKNQSIVMPLMHRDLSGCWKLQWRSIHCDNWNASRPVRMFKELLPKKDQLWWIRCLETCRSVEN